MCYNISCFLVSIYFHLTAKLILGRWRIYLLWSKANHQIYFLFFTNLETPLLLLLKGITPLIFHSPWGKLSYILSKMESTCGILLISTIARPECINQCLFAGYLSLTDRKVRGDVVKKCSSSLPNIVSLEPIYTSKCTTWLLYV